MRLGGPEPRGWDAYDGEAQPRMGFFTDTSLCIGCKACEVACKEWNELPEDGSASPDSPTTTRDA